ncbi:thioredoxin family protein [Oecophyllibacter saccharovorans]|nr:thioredoxin family protein [Oecophyllibacter saccharovorans]
MVTSLTKHFENSRNTPSLPAATLFSLGLGAFMILSSAHAQTPQSSTPAIAALPAASGGAKPASQATQATKIPGDADAKLLPPAPAPHLAETTVEPEPTPYPAADLAPTQVREAFMTAARTHRRVLLVFGANWCPDCRILAGIFSLPDVALWLEKNFVVVPVNVERLQTNLDLASRYGVKITAIPTVLVLTPQGRLLNPDTAESLGNARRMSPQAVVDLIAEWAQH